MNQLEQFKQITTFVFDVDGVMTDSHLLVTESGALLRKMSVRDGYAIKTALRQGWSVCVITGGSSKGVTSRLKNLGVQDIFSGIQDKVAVLKKYMEVNGLDKKQVLYLGDDLPDYEVMQTVGLPCCPSDATPEVKDISLYISPMAGGNGCVRDVIEKVLKIHDKWI